MKGFRNGAALLVGNQAIGRTPAGRKKAAMEVGSRKEGSCALPLWLRRIGKVKMPLLNGDDTSFWLALDKGLEQGSRTELELSGSPLSFGRIPVCIHGSGRTPS